MKITLRLCLLLLLAFVGAAAGTLHAANWYIDNSLANSANTGTSWANAWTNLALNYDPGVWAQVQPGDTVYISGGAISQTYPAPFTFGASGTSNNYVTYSVGTDAGHNGKVIIDAQNQLNFSGNSTCVGIACGMSWVHVTGLPGTNLVIQNVAPPSAFVTGNRELGVAFYGGIPQNQIIDGILISNACNGFSYNGMYNIEISYCSLVGICGDYCFRFDGYGGPLGTNMLNAHVHHCSTLQYADFIGINGGPDGVQCLNGVTLNDCVFRCTNGVVAVGQHPDGIQALGSYVRVYNNYFANFLNSGVKFEPLAPTTEWVECYAYDNIVTVDDPKLASNPLANNKGTELGSAGVMTNVHDVVIANNSFVGCMGLGVNGGGGTWPIRGLIVENNLIYNCGGGGGVVCDIGPSKMVFDYNLINAGPSGCLLVMIDLIGNGSSFVPFAQAHGLAGAPAFVNYVPLRQNNDFHLAAADAAATGDGINLAGLIPAFDKDGNPRSPGGAWDIGAYDSTATINANAPPPVQGLHIIKRP